MLHKTMRAYLSVALTIVIASAAVALILAPTVAQATEHRLKVVQTMAPPQLAECYAFASTGELYAKAIMYRVALRPAREQDNARISYFIGYAQGYVVAAAEFTNQSKTVIATNLYNNQCGR